MRCEGGRARLEAKGKAGWMDGLGKTKRREPIMEGTKGQEAKSKRKGRAERDDGRCRDKV